MLNPHKSGQVYQPAASGLLRDLIKSRADEIAATVVTDAASCKKGDAFSVEGDAASAAWAPG